MTLTQMISLAKARFRDTANDVVDDAMWVQYINEAYKAFLVENDWLVEEAVTTLSLPAQTRSVSLPANALSVMAVRDVTNHRKLWPVPTNRSVYEMWPDLELTSAQAPEAYRPIGADLHVFPLVSSPVTIEIIYRAEPADLVALGSSPILPLRYHRALVDGALSFAYQDDQNMESAAAAQERFNAAVRAANHDLSTRRSEGFPQIDDDFWSD